MALTPGTRLGPYEVTAQIGEGGMGQVWRATDTKLKRQVAIKVLPPLLAADPDRLARFQREAQVLASLNHPNIAGIYGLEEGSADAGHYVRALVMELVEGDDLSQRIARDAVPMDEALSIAKQIADALEAAHEQGIVHRDLKPANIKVRPDGTVKVLDFGLAKAMDPVSGIADRGFAHASQAPTITSPAMMTGAGMILGTAAYMAPEQASGKPVDKRADIWAFGVVVWEMLAGRRLFEGETVSHVLAAVLTQEPDLSAVPPRTRRLLARCLEKDPKKRLRDIGDAMSLVQSREVPAPGEEAVAAAVARPRTWLSVGGWATAGVLVLALAAAAWLRPAAITDADPPTVRFQIERAADIYANTAGTFAVSPDGLMIAHYGAGQDGQALFVRTLATGDLREVPVTGTAFVQRDSLFWSSDSRQLVRGTVSGAQVFDVANGTTRPLCDCRFIGGSWNREGAILLGSLVGAREGIRRLSVGDPTPSAITTPDGSRGEEDMWPVFLPDGRRFLFTRSTPGVGFATYIGSLDGAAPVRIADGSRRIVVPATGGGGPYLLGFDSAGLVAQRFDMSSSKVTGEAVTLVPEAVAASASENGVLATSAPGSRPRVIATWFDRAGRPLGVVGEAGMIEGIALSPDGRKLAVAESVVAANVPTADIWLRDLVTGARSRVTFNPGNESTPVWSPDGARIAFTSARDGAQRLYQRAADGTGNESPLFAYDRPAWVNDWTRDRRWVIFSSGPPGGVGNDLWSLPMSDGTAGTPVPYLVAPGRQQQAQFSPDGRFVAYGSDESGTFEIYVQPFPNASEGKWMVSSGGGAEPRWSPDGKELYYFSGQTLMALPVTLQPTFSSGAPAAIFDAPVLAGYPNDSDRWQVAPDGRRFLLLTNAGQDQAPPLDVIVNWPALLNR